jgi:hypothetical protein
MIYLTKHNSLSIFQFKTRDFNFEPIIDTTFEWLINPKTPIAVKVNCIEILVNLRSKSDWIEEELRAQIEFLLKDGGPAVQSRARKMLEVLGFESESLKVRKSESQKVRKSASRKVGKSESRKVGKLGSWEVG